MNRILAGYKVTLEVDRGTDFGFYLTDGEEDVLLHRSEIVDDIEIGDQVKVFIYYDKQGRLAATMRIPEVQVGKYGWAEVVSVKRDLGVFVNIGLVKDILVSLDELPAIMSLWPAEGDSLFITLKLDKQERLFGQLATEDIIQREAVPAPKGIWNQTIKGNVYRLLKVGSFVFSEQGYRCFLHESERKSEPRLGELVEGRVIDQKDDGSLNISLLPFKQEKMDDDSEAIYTYLLRRGGAMPYGDKTSPEDIQFHFRMSKGAFKRALGKLMKDGKIYQEDGWSYTIDKKQDE
ncbi:hypothetical protein D0469_17220 [Peribacillus saganii]|uniref:S1 motif domain-containing protein n=1 Tax=Peribacillus saganii TaxID=2303992 RepID=A0A372LK23_9BACI|nr:S1-like domain-containing RNA-binding protein [Peribacillus saganii]RFU66374.1 hypothetical protein D0469_17220 [Peribacillus saganii]